MCHYAHTSCYTGHNISVTGFSGPLYVQQIATAFLKGSAPASALRSVQTAATHDQWRVEEGMDGGSVTPGIYIGGGYQIKKITYVDFSLTN